MSQGSYGNLICIVILFLGMISCEEQSVNCDTFNEGAGVTFEQVMIDTESDSLCPMLDTTALNETMSIQNCSTMVSEGLDQQCSFIQSCELDINDDTLARYDLTVAVDAKEKFTGDLEVNTSDLICRYTVSGSMIGAMQ